MVASALEGRFINVTQEHDYLVTKVSSFDEMKALPGMVEYNGVVYGLTGWNSDKGEAYYKTWAAANYAKAVT